MAKTISVDNLTYTKLVSLTGELMNKTGKPWSIGQTVWVVNEIFEGLDELFEIKKKIIKILKESETLSPEEFEKQRDAIIASMERKVSR